MTSASEWLGSGIMLLALVLAMQGLGVAGLWLFVFAGLALGEAIDD